MTKAGFLSAEPFQARDLQDASCVECGLKLEITQRFLPRVANMRINWPSPSPRRKVLQRLRTDVFLRSSLTHSAPRFHPPVHPSQAEATSVGDSFDCHASGGWMISPRLLPTAPCLCSEIHKCAGCCRPHGWGRFCVNVRAAVPVVAPNGYARWYRSPLPRQNPETSPHYSV